MRHSRFILRLLLASPISLAVTLGLLLVPVECSVAAGPHSIFVDAGSLASLQVQGASVPSGAHFHAHPPADEHVTSHLTALGQDFAQSAMVHFTVQLPERAPADHGHHPEPASDSSTAQVQVSATASPPSTAGFVSDAIVALLLPGLEADFTAIEPDQLAMTEFQIPPDHLLRGPEPPPG